MKNTRIKSRQFAIFSKAKHFHSTYLKAMVVNALGEHYGFAVGKRVSRLAVIRNKIKRRLRHILRQQLVFLPKDCWIVFVAFKEAAEVDFRTLEEDFKKLVHTINAKKGFGSSHKDL